MSFLDKIKPRIAQLPTGYNLKQPLMYISTWFGSGLLRPAPGTMGSIAALPFGIALQYIGGITALGIGIVIVFIVGVKAANGYETASGEKDSKSIVIDEVAGMWIAGIPAATNIYLWLFAFILFRIFDAWKPWPISKIDREVKGGFGVMLDDVVAGFIAMCGVASLSITFLGVL